MVRNAGKMLNVMMTRGVPPALGDVIQGSVIFARVRVRLDCMERRGATAADAAAAEPQPTTHVITVEIPFQPLKFDDVAMPSEEASVKASSQDSAPAKGEDTAAAAAGEGQGKGARDAEPHAEKQAHEEAPQDAAERDGEEGSGASAGSSDALPAIPQGLKPTSDGEVPLTKAGASWTSMVCSQ
ncbi:unnamed protein product [Symbiodinium sp. KB8]|nr:unnamed protein product [Symbiodinium sp. KB8]